MGVIEAGAVEELTAREVEALRGAAVWYAKYHSSRVSERIGDEAASAVAEREEYLDLLGALGKLGVRLRTPDGLAETARAA